MKRNGNLRSFVVLALVLGAVVIVVAGIGCFGGGDGGTVTTSSSPPAAEGSTTLEPGGAVSFDKLSSFRAKDPFKPQAVVAPTTTAATTTTLLTTTTTRPPTTVTTRSTTTTAPTTTTVPVVHRLVLIVVFAPDPPDFPNDRVHYAIDGVLWWDQEVGSVQFHPAGKIEVLEIDSVAGTATFRRDDNPATDFELRAGETQTWL